MKIKVPPRNAAPQGQTIIIKEQREGCFLRTLNFGCATIVLLAIGFGLLVVWGPIWFGSSSQSGETSSGKALHADAAPTAASDGKGVQPAAAPSTPKPQPKATGLYFFQESKDAMTDAARYIFAWKSKRSREPFSLIDETIILRFSPTQVERSTHKMEYDVECIIHSDLSYVGRRETIAAVRFDDRPARDWKCSPSTNGEGLFIDDARGFLSEIAYARRCRVRFNDFGKQQHDLDFDLGLFSLQDFREKIVDCVLKSNPPNVEIVE